MSRKSSWLVLMVALVCVVAAAWGGGGWLWQKVLEMHGVPPKIRPGSIPGVAASGVAIPFKLVTQHIMLEVTVNGSRPLSFILDTGNKWALVDLDLAKELGVTLGQEVAVAGVGSRRGTGAFVREGAFSIPGFEGFSQPVALAIPLGALPPRLGQKVDGILGTDFISQFVLEVDYQARVITLLNKDTFTYSGSGESIPMRLNAQGHPVIEAEVTPVGGDPIKGTFLLDIGSSGSLALHSPFVAEHHLPGPDVKTITGLAGGGTGGDASGKTGRVSELRIGRAALVAPIAFFSEDKAGAYADSTMQGSIGARLANRFKLFLDYSHSRIIFEPTAALGDAFDRASPGFRVDAEGADYRTFRIKEVLPASPASEAGLQEGDIITGIDERAASDLTLSEVGELFERSVARKVTVRRGERTMDVTLTPRPLV